MKQFLSFIRKEFYHIFRDSHTVMILLLMPVIQMLLFGFALTTEVKNTPFAVLDMTKDATTQGLIEEMNKNNYFTLTRYLKSESEIQDVLKKGEASLVIVFPENFHQNILHTGEGSIQLIADATEPNQAISYTNYASNVIANYGRKMLNGFSSPIQITPQIKMLYNPQMEGTYNFVPAVMGLILMLICSMMTSISIVREKEMGTMEILLASPMKPFYIILSKVAPYFVLGVIDLLLILALGVFVLQVPISGNIVLLFFVSFLFILAALSLGLLISNIVNTQVAAMIISGIGLMMPSIILSGLVFPIESMPNILQYLSAILPIRWFIQAIRKVMIQGVDFVYVLKECAILTAMVVILLTVSLKMFNKRLNK